MGCLITPVKCDCSSIPLETCIVLSVIGFEVEECLLFVLYPVLKKISIKLFARPLKGDYLASALYQLAQFYTAWAQAFSSCSEAGFCSQCLGLVLDHKVKILFSISETP